MALSEKEKARIVEEEELRFQVKQRLKAEHGCSCGGHGHGCCGRHRWIFWVLGIVLVVGILKMICLHGMCHMGRGPMGPGCRMWGGPPPAEGQMVPGQEAPAPVEKGKPGKK